VTADLSRLAALARSPLDGYEHADAKDAYHRLAVKMLRQLSRQLGGGEVRSNRAGPGVPGEVSLTAPTMYVQVCTGGILYRRASPADPYGAHSANVWLTWEDAEKDGVRSILNLATAP
jgi:hypothetical protein